MRAHPDADAASNLSIANSLAQALGEHHKESLPRAHPPPHSIGGFRHFRKSLANDARAGEETRGLAEVRQADVPQEMSDVGSM
jgi:hypothetical protein